ncbi:hypothetical protein BDQ17DRAFT_163790 [Cyathus striatus]|nr:hypothetical protein BDQ17DRAFT_163790 [Cyathus striatus]
MTQTQEEMLLIGGFALFWIGEFESYVERIFIGTHAGQAILVGWRHCDKAENREPCRAFSWGKAKLTPYGLCSDDDVYCVVEEYFSR